MDISSAKRIARFINTVILILVFGLMSFFCIFKVTILAWFSIPTAMVYIIGYAMIHKEKLTAYVRIVYFWLTLYMSLSTLCLGYGYGFHLYCFSMIPTIFVTEYMSYKLGRGNLNACLISFAIAVIYLAATGYVSYFGPVYEIDNIASSIFWAFNALTVFGFLIFYSKTLITLIINSEKKLIEDAHFDSLTKLYNRHYMLELMSDLSELSSKSFLAMADIDNFKKLNDTYGHNGGDEVLRRISAKMRDICNSCTVARWGGEEFLIYSSEAAPDDRDMLERLRESIESEPIMFGGKEINVTITIGMAYKEESQSVDSWVQSADDKLYFGKNNGKNRVIV